MKPRIPYCWDKTRLYLHFGFAGCVIIQLLSSLVMHRPYLGRKITAIQANAFILHSYSGLAATLLLIAYWWWLINRSPATLYHLFSWLSKNGLYNLWLDCQSLLFKLKLPDAKLCGGLPGFVQALGLLLVSFLGFTGTLLFLSLPNTQQIPAWVALIKETHGTVAPLVWWYIGGHAGMASLHGLKVFLLK